MHNQESVLGKEMHKILCDFEIQTGRRPNLVRAKKKKKKKKEPADQRVKLKESKKGDKFPDLARESDIYTNCNWCAWCSHQRIDKGTGGLGNKRMSGNHLTTALLRSARILRRVLAVTQTPVKDHRQTLVCKTLKRVK